MMNELENNVSFFRFEDLRIYDKSMEYIDWLYGKMTQIPCDNAVTVRFPIAAFLKSASKIALNTAEGSSRSKSQFLYYMKLAKSAVRECVVFTEISRKVSIFDDEMYEHSRNQLMELTKMIGSLISSLQRSIGSSAAVDKTENPMGPMSDIDEF